MGNVDAVMLVLAGVVPTVGGTAEPVNRDQRAVEDRVHRSLRDEHRLGQARRQPGEQVDRLAHVAVHRATPAQGAGHAGPVAQVVEDPQDGVESRGGVPVLAEPVVDQREVAEGAGFAAAVANCAPDGEGSTVPVSGAGQLSAPPVDVPQAGQGLGLGLALAEPAGGLAGVAVDRGGVGVLTGLEAVAGQDGGQVDALPALAVVGLVPDRGHEVRPLRVQPGAGGDLVSRWRSDRGGDRAGLPFVGPAGAQGLDCDACRDEVVVEQPGERGVPVWFRVVSEGLLGGVRAEQVVHAKAPRAVGFHEVGVGECVEHPDRFVDSGAGERGQGVPVDIDAWMQAEQPECLGGRWRQDLVRP